jgi:ATP-dependent Clp protease ATP-binding subunit ClpA
VLQDPTSVACRALSPLVPDLDELAETTRGAAANSADLHSQEPGLGPYARKAIELAVAEALTARQSSVKAEHLLLGLLGSGSPSIDNLFRARKVSLAQARAQVLDVLGKRPRWQIFVPLPEPEQVLEASPAALGAHARAAIQQAQLVARWHYHPRVDTPHLLAGLLRERSGRAAQVLGAGGVELGAVLAQLAGPTTVRSAARVGYTARASAAITRARAVAGKRGLELAGTAHLLDALLVDSACEALLAALGADTLALSERVSRLLATDD